MNNRALFIGLTTVDIQYFVKEFPKANTKVKTDQPLVAAGGPSANAAITYVFMGGNADFLTCIGENSFTQLLHDDYKMQRVNIIDYKQDEAFQPIVATVITSTNNSDRTIITHHPDKLKEARIEKLQINITKYDFVFVDGFYPELAIPICRLANENGIPVILDGGSWKPQLHHILPFVSIAICSNNYRPPGCNTLKSCFEFTKNHGVEYVAISRGSKSIVCENTEINIAQVKAIDSLGAGDILHGAFCWYNINEKNNFDDALLKASIVASKSVEYKGTRSWMNSSIQ